jgi:hypothetical protein
MRKIASLKFQMKMLTAFNTTITTFSASLKRKRTNILKEEAK